MNNKNIDQAVNTNDITLNNKNSDQLQRIYELAAKVSEDRLKAAVSYFENLSKK